MIGQRQCDAVAQRRLGKFILRIEDNTAVAAKAQFRIKPAEGLDQIGLAMEIDRVLIGRGFYPIDPDRAAAFRLGGEVTRLPPLQGFLQCADARGGRGRVEDQPTQSQQFCLDRLWIGVENRIDRGI